MSWRFGNTAPGNLCRVSGRNFKRRQESSTENRKEMLPALGQELGGDMKENGALPEALIG